MINTCHCERSEAIQPIYIDGVDVSKCKFYSEKLECCNGNGFIQVANGCGFCTHNIRGLDDADVYVQTFAHCLNNECYYKELKARGRMKLYNEYTPKELYEKFGIISVHFEPYDDMSYLWETDSIKSLTQSVKELAYSTIFEDFRYYFKDAESLKNFIKEQTNEK